MTKRVTVLIEVNFETRDEPAANAAVMRIPGDLTVSIEHGKLGHAYTGVIPGSVKINVKERAIT